MIIIFVVIIFRSPPLSSQQQRQTGGGGRGPGGRGQHLVVQSHTNNPLWRGILDGVSTWKQNSLLYAPGRWLLLLSYKKTKSSPPPPFI